MTWPDTNKDLRELHSAKGFPSGNGHSNLASFFMPVFIVIGVMVVLIVVFILCIKSSRKHGDTKQGNKQRRNYRPGSWGHGDGNIAGDGTTAGLQDGYYGGNDDTGGGFDSGGGGCDSGGGGGCDSGGGGGSCDSGGGGGSCDSGGGGGGGGSCD